MKRNIYLMDNNPNKLKRQKTINTRAHTHTHEIIRATKSEQFNYYYGINSVGGHSFRNE